MAFQKELKVALMAVKNAASLCQRVQRQLGVISSIEKEDRSPVTLADFGSQAIINMELRKAFPKDPIVGEETAEALLNDSNVGEKVLDLVSHEGYPATLDEIISAIDYILNRE